MADDMTKPVFKWAREREPGADGPQLRDALDDVIAADQRDPAGLDAVKLAPGGDQVTVPGVAFEDSTELLRQRFGDDGAEQWTKVLADQTPETATKWIEIIKVNPTDTVVASYGELGLRTRDLPEVLDGLESATCDRLAGLVAARQAGADPADLRAEMIDAVRAGELQPQSGSLVEGRMQRWQERQAEQAASDLDTAPTDTPTSDVTPPRLGDSDIRNPWPDPDPEPPTVTPPPSDADGVWDPTPGEDDDRDLTRPPVLRQTDGGDAAASTTNPVDGFATFGHGTTGLVREPTDAFASFGEGTTGLVRESTDAFASYGEGTTSVFSAPDDPAAGVPGLEPPGALASLAGSVTADEPDIALPTDDGLIGDELG